MGVPKFLKLGLPWIWRPIILFANLWLIWGLKRSCNPSRELSNAMSHVTYMQGNQGDSKLLVVESQIVNLTSDPSFDHNLCFRCPNWSCKPNSKIYILRAFQWYKGRFNPMSFDPCNHFFKIQESIRISTPTPKVGAHLKVWGFFPSHSPTLPRA